MDIDLEFVISNIDQLDNFANKLSKELILGDTILLDGELGSGKTELVKAVGRHLGVIDEITSPTYCFLNTYEVNKNFKIYHFDLYRLESEDRLSEIGFDECGFNPGDGVSFIEWASNFIDCMPKDALRLKFSGQGDSPRIIEPASYSERWSKFLARAK